MKLRSALVAAIAAVLVAAGVAVAAPGLPGPDAEIDPRRDLCPRPGDFDCYSLPIPAQGYVVAGLAAPAPGQEALYDSLVPAPFEPAADRQVAVSLIKLEIPGDAGTRSEPTPDGYMEGSLALRAVYPPTGEEGWFPLTTPVNDQAQYDSGRAQGIPKQMADITLRSTDAGWDATAVKPGGGPLIYDLSLDLSRPAAGDADAVRSWTRLDDPFWTLVAPWDEPDDDGRDAKRVRFAPVPLTSDEESGLGTLTVTIADAGTPWEGLIAPVTQMPGMFADMEGAVVMTFDTLETGVPDGDSDPGSEPEPEDPTPIEGGVPKPTAEGGIVPVAHGGACAGGGHAGGEWPTYARDLTGNRFQEDEATIGPLQAVSLQPAWTFPLGDIPNIVNSTPVVADGCLYFGTSRGSVSGRFAGNDAGSANESDFEIFALNADTGEPVWQLTVPTMGEGVLGTGVVGSLAVDVAAGIAYAIVSSLDNPYTIAMDHRTGEVIWATLLDDKCGAYSDASPVLYDGLLFAGWNEDLQRDCAHGGYSVLDATTGEVLVKNTPIPQEDFEKGFTGASVWATAAVDTATGFAFVGTSNPNNLTAQHPHTNAIIKIDLNRMRADGTANPDFGLVVDHYEGDKDNVVEMVTGEPFVTPLCTEVRPALGPVTEPTLGDSAFTFDMATCLNGDQDFGASPQLFEIDGRMAVGELQKSGTYHVAWADTMESVWRTRIGALCVICNAGTAATDGDTIYVVGSPPGALFALDAATGAIEWATPVADVLHFQGITLANGVVYTVDSAGSFDAYDAATGIPLLHRPVGLDNGGDFGASFGNLAGSVAVARNTVYVGSGAYVGAYRPATG